MADDLRLADYQRLADHPIHRYLRDRQRLLEIGGWPGQARTFLPSAWPSIP